jgi:hypothetical protein
MIEQLINEKAAEIMGRLDEAGQCSFLVQDAPEEDTLASVVACED